MDIQPIETRYKGYKFRSRLEAKWAVFFDACGIDWDYEPEGYNLGDGIYYLPDFVLHNVKARSFSGDLYVEVKGYMTEEDELKIEKFYEIFKGDDPFLSNKPLLVVANIPWGQSIYKLFNFVYETQNKFWGFFNYHYCDGDNWPTLLVLDKNKNLRLMDANCNEDCLIVNEKATLEAYQKAREARFEHGESPK